MSLTVMSSFLIWDTCLTMHGWCSTNSKLIFFKYNTSHVHHRDHHKRCGCHCRLVVYISFSLLDNKSSTPLNYPILQKINKYFLLPHLMCVYTVKTNYNLRATINISINSKIAGTTMGKNSFEGAGLVSTFRTVYPSP